MTGRPPLDCQPTLRGELIELRPLRADDFDALYAVASDPDIWTQHPEPDRWQRATFERFFQGAIDSKSALVAIDRATGEIIGSSRYHGYDPNQSIVEIGWTFLKRDYWGGQYNGEMKRLMIDHAFRSVDTVIFMIGKNNQRSRRAIERVGATYVGPAPEPNDHVMYEVKKRSEDTTIAHYDTNAQRFWEGTMDHDVRQNIDAMLRHIQGDPPYKILDFGCGPGRDLKTLKDLAHDPIGLDGSKEFVQMARAHSQCEVWLQNFLALDLPDNHFDAIFANASLFHVPTKDLPRVLTDLHATLKQRGVLFSSNPHGQDQEGWNQDRYGAYHSLETWRTYLEKAGFEELEHYYRPTGLPREQQPWLATVWRKS